MSIYILEVSEGKERRNEAGKTSWKKKWEKFPVFGEKHQPINSSSAKV